MMQLPLLALIHYQQTQCRLSLPMVVLVGMISLCGDYTTDPVSEESGIPGV